MDLAKIHRAVQEIERLERALGWLSEYGAQIADACDEGVAYRPNFAGSCLGADEAAAVLREMMKDRLPGLIQVAIVDCRNAIEAHRQTIRAEAA